MENFYEECEQDNIRYVLDTKTVDDILGEQYITSSYIVENFLYNGTYIFAGAPKVGKSFFALQLAYAVSKGTDFLGHATSQSDVLYLALEDTYIRLQKRIAQMFGTDDNERLHIAVNAGNLHEKNLIIQLENFVTMHKKTRLIIIDTLQKVRETSSDYSYGRDYADVTEIKKFADSFEVCVVIIHHTRKMQDNDKFLMISGTNGIMGSADGAFVMYKNGRLENEAVIEISSRDITDERIKVHRNRDNLCWELKESSAVYEIYHPDDAVKAVSMFINPDNPSWEGTAGELIEDLGAEGQITPTKLTRTLNINVNEMYDNYGICYITRKSNGKTLLKLVLDVNKIQNQGTLQ